MIEYRTERVDPEREDEVMQLLHTFGWVPISSQEVYHENTELTDVEVKSYGAFMQGFTGKDGAINVTQRKNVTNYVVLKFGRDTEMPYYQKLKELESEYENKININEPKKPIKRTAVMIIGILIILYSIYNAFVEHITAELWEIGVCIIFPIIFIPITIKGWIKYKKDFAIYLSIQNRLRSIYQEAANLVK